MGVLIKRALPFEVYILAAHSWKLPYIRGPLSVPLKGDVGPDTITSAKILRYVGSILGFDLVQRSSFTGPYC